MSLEHILLGMLRQPAAGYDLRREFVQGASFFWSAELAQIYPTLQAMERKGWLNSRKEPSEQGPPRRVYERTRKGTQELHKWLRAEPVMGAERFAYLGQLIFMGELHDPQATLQFVQQLRAKQAALLQILQSALQEIEQQGPPDKASMNEAEFHDWLCLQLGCRAVSARVAFCDEVQGLLERRIKQATAKGKSR